MQLESPVVRRVRGLMSKAVSQFQRARVDLAAFIPLVCQDDHGTPLSLAPVHSAWLAHVDYCWRRKLKALILAPFGHGKCLTRCSTLQLADGSTTTHGQIVGLTVPVVAYSADGQYRRVYATGFGNGLRRVWRFVFDSGRQLEVTDEHPWLTLSGWLAARDVEVGRYVAAANSIRGLGALALRDGEAVLMGALIGDGALTGGHMTFTKYDPDMRAAVVRAAESLGFTAHDKPIAAKIANNPEAKYLAFSRGDDRCGFGGPREWARLRGLLGCGSYQKRTPPAIFTAPDHQIAQYVGAYFSCDGSIDNSSRNGVELYSVNRGLLDDVQTLLARLGIVSRVRPKKGRYKGKVHHSWRLCVAWSFVPLFAERVPLIGGKAEKLVKLCEALRANSRLGNGDLVPLEYRQFLKRTPYWHKKNSGIGLDQCGHFGKPPKGTERGVVRQAARDEQNDYLLRMTAPEIVWDRVVAKEDMGIQPTVGVDVDEHHTYLAGGMIVHNSSSLLVPLAAYCIGRDPNTRIKVVTNDDDSASKRVATVGKILETPAYRSVFPGVRPGNRWTGHEVYVERTGQAIDPTIQARGIFTTGIGGRADVELFDDIVDQKNAANAIQRSRVMDLAEQTWLSRLEPDGNVLGIGTVWHNGDAYHHWMQQPGWCTLVQSVADDCLSIEQVVYGAGDDYPGLAP